MKIQIKETDSTKIKTENQSIGTKFPRPLFVKGLARKAGRLEVCKIKDLCFLVRGFNLIDYWLDRMEKKSKG